MNIQKAEESMIDTWNRAKWMRWRTNWGRPNQKYLSEPCTKGIPWTTACLSVISIAIFVNMAWSSVPIARMICNIIIIFTYVKLDGWMRSSQRNEFLQLQELSMPRKALATLEIWTKCSLIDYIWTLHDNGSQYFSWKQGLPFTLRSKKITKDAHSTGLSWTKMNCQSTYSEWLSVNISNLSRIKQHEMIITLLLPQVWNHLLKIFWYISGN